MELVAYMELEASCAGLLPVVYTAADTCQLEADMDCSLAEEEAAAVARQVAVVGNAAEADVVAVVASVDDRTRNSQKEQLARA